MEVEFEDPRLDQLETDPAFSAAHQSGIVTAFRKRMQFIRAALDERDLYEWRALRFEKLKGNRQHQHSIRLNDQWRLILEMRGKGSQKKIVIISIEDYH